MINKTNQFLTKLEGIAAADVAKLIEAEKSYGDSWKRRGGVGAFMMLARKWDRIEKQVSEKGYDIFAACIDDKRKEGVIDDVRDLRQYLTLVEAELQVRGHHGTLVIPEPEYARNESPDPIYVPESEHSST
jgi:hypothetical protein